MLCSRHSLDWHEGIVAQRRHHHAEQTHDRMLAHDCMLSHMSPYMLL